MGTSLNYKRINKKYFYRKHGQLKVLEDSVNTNRQMNLNNKLLPAPRNRRVYGATLAKNSTFNYGSYGVFRSFVSLSARYRQF